MTAQFYGRHATAPANTCEQKRTSNLILSLHHSRHHPSHQPCHHHCPSPSLDLCVIPPITPPNHLLHHSLINHPSHQLPSPICNSKTTHHFSLLSFSGSSNSSCTRRWSRSNSRWFLQVQTKGDKDTHHHCHLHITCVGKGWHTHVVIDLQLLYAHARTHTRMHAYTHTHLTHPCTHTHNNYYVQNIRTHAYTHTPYSEIQPLQYHQQQLSVHALEPLPTWFRSHDYPQ